MANLTEAQILMVLKSFNRANNIPLDASSVWDTKANAEAYAKQANAYGGQVVTALVDGKYKTFVLQPADSGFTLEEVGTVHETDLKQYVQVVDDLPTSGQEQGVIYITGTTGQIWTGTAWKVVFKEVSTKVDEIGDKVTALETELAKKAPLANPEFTGKVTIGGDEVAVKSYVDGLINGLASSAPGIVNSKNPLPSTGYKAGQTFRVAEAGTYAGQKCEEGDLVIVTKDYADGASDADFMVVQANIDGAVTSTTDVATVGEIVVFNSVSGKVIGRSEVSIDSLKDAISKAHTHKNADILDSFTKNQTEILEDAATAAQGKVDTLEQTINGKLDAVNDTLKTKITADQAATQISDALTARVGEIPAEKTVKAYVDEAVAAGSAGVKEDIAKDISTAKTEAVDSAKTYTDEAIAKVHSVVEF